VLSRPAARAAGKFSFNLGMCNRTPPEPDNRPGRNASEAVTSCLSLTSAEVLDQILAGAQAKGQDRERRRLIRAI
jgi:hypothetical protein